MIDDYDAIRSSILFPDGTGTVLYIPNDERDLFMDSELIKFNTIHVVRFGSDVRYKDVLVLYIIHYT